MHKGRGKTRAPFALKCVCVYVCAYVCVPLLHVSFKYAFKTLVKVVGPALFQINIINNERRLFASNFFHLFVDDRIASEHVDRIVAICGQNHKVIFSIRIDWSRKYYMNCKRLTIKS